MPQSRRRSSDRRRRRRPARFFQSARFVLFRRSSAIRSIVVASIVRDDSEPPRSWFLQFNGPNGRPASHREGAVPPPVAVRATTSRAAHFRWMVVRGLLGRVVVPDGLVLAVSIGTLVLGAGRSPTYRPCLPARCSRGSDRRALVPSLGSSRWWWGVSKLRALLGPVVQLTYGLVLPPRSSRGSIRRATVPLSVRFWWWGV